MNERIKLPAQEWLSYDPELGDIHGYTFEQMREFAELLIQECIITIKKRYMGDNNREDMEVLRCVSELKNRFGVELWVT